VRRNHPQQADVLAAGVAAAAVGAAAGSQSHPALPAAFTSASSAQQAFAPDGAGPPQQPIAAFPCEGD
jgi:hypothetical protein